MARMGNGVWEDWVKYERKHSVLSAELLLQLSSTNIALLGRILHPTNDYPSVGIHI
jgi:hypothetical protein